MEGRVLGYGYVMEEDAFGTQWRYRAQTANIRGATCILAEDQNCLNMLLGYSAAGLLCLFSGCYPLMYEMRSLLLLSGREEIQHCFAFVAQFPNEYQLLPSQSRYLQPLSRIHKKHQHCRFV